MKKDLLDQFSKFVLNVHQLVASHQTWREFFPSLKWNGDCESQQEIFAGFREKKISNFPRSTRAPTQKPLLFCQPYRMINTIITMVMKGAVKYIRLGKNAIKQNNAGANKKRKKTQHNHVRWFLLLRFFPFEAKQPNKSSQFMIVFFFITFALRTQGKT